MSDKLNPFLAFSAILVGIGLLANVGILGATFLYHWEMPANPPYIQFRVIEWGNIFQALLGVALLAGGITHFWTRSRFHRP